MPDSGVPPLASVRMALQGGCSQLLWRRTLPSSAPLSPRVLLHPTCAPGSSPSPPGSSPRCVDKGVQSQIPMWPGEGAASEPVWQRGPWLPRTAQGPGLRPGKEAGGWRGLLGPTRACSATSPSWPTHTRHRPPVPRLASTPTHRRTRVRNEAPAGPPAGEPS